MTRCPKCNCPIKEGWRMCPRCGTEFANANAKKKERALDDAGLIAKAIGTTLLLNLPWMMFLREKGEPYALYIGDWITPIVGGMLFGLALLLFLEWLGIFFPTFDKDWTLIVSWRQAWRRWNIILGLFLSFIMGWWWLLGVIFVYFSLGFGIGLVFLVCLFLTPLFSLANWGLGWIYAFFATIANRFFIFIPYFPREEDRKKVEEAIKDIYDKFRKERKDGS